MSWFEDVLRSRSDKTRMITPDEALPGRDTPVLAPGAVHFVNGHPLQPPFPDGLEAIVLAGGCFWGIEEIFWGVPGVYTTAAGYAGGVTPNPTYEEVCTARTGHAESVLVVFDPAVVSLERLLAVFWESHDPTLGMRQGNDVGTQYRSAVFATSEAQLGGVEATAEHYARRLAAAGIDDPITTEIGPLVRFYWAEDYHQQYLAKNPSGYRCHAAAGVAFDG
ncbi:peptide-methionine (S)-S-oxide reductase MsrA [Tsukamurella soli]|uniref:Peptide methionine sulfoxide reductase MsrA n=1 Tax=Tsukamurella soli TaxID=644556 RepID=A0ABP8KCU7_9ACTN